MESPGNDRRDFARAIYETHVRQWRTVELGRLVFAAVYVVVVVGTLAAVGDGVFEARQWPAALFLLALAKIGYLMSFHQESDIHSHRRAARYILERYSLMHYWADEQPPLLIRLVPIARLYSVLYLFSFCFFMMALLNVVTGNAPLSLAVAAAFYVLGFFVTIWWKRPAA